MCQKTNINSIFNGQGIHPFLVQALQTHGRTRCFVSKGRGPPKESLPWPCSRLATSRPCQPRGRAALVSLGDLAKSHPYLPHLYIISLCHFLVLQDRTLTVVTEIIWPTRHTYLLSGSLQRKGLPVPTPMVLLTHLSDLTVHHHLYPLAQLRV